MSFESVFKHIQRVKESNSKWLILDQQGLTSIPTEIQHLTQLKQLSLINNGLTDITGLEKLPQLVELRLDNNLITHIDPSIVNMPQLKELNLSNNPISPFELNKLRWMLPNTKIIHVRPLFIVVR